MLHPDQYRFGIKSPVLLYSLSQKTLQNQKPLNQRLLDPYNHRTNQLNRLRYYDLQLETALCYQHCFCNTELRTTTKNRIKGFRSRLNEIRLYHLHFILTLTLDERKTLTKVSTRKTSHYHSPKKQAHTSDNKCKRLPNNPGTRKPVKSFLHNWWRIRSIRISSRNNGRIKKRQDRFCIKLHIIFYEIRFVILLYGFTTVIRTKTLFLTQVKYYKFPL